MRLVVIGASLSLCAAPALAQSKPTPFPYKVEANVISTGWGTDVLQFTVLPVAFDMNVSGIKLNRGNCQVWESRVINGRIVNAVFPMPLKFGLKRAFWSQANCEPREMVITTIEGGEFTLRFTD